MAHARENGNCSLQQMPDLPSHVRRIGTIGTTGDRKSTRLNSSHDQISYAVFCLKKKKTTHQAFLSPSSRHRTPPTPAPNQPNVRPSETYRSPTRIFLKSQNHYLLTQRSHPPNVT